MKTRNVGRDWRKEEGERRKERGREEGAESVDLSATGLDKQTRKGQIFAVR